MHRSHRLNYSIVRLMESCSHLLLPHIAKQKPPFRIRFDGLVDDRRKLEPLLLGKMSPVKHTAYTIGESSRQ